MSQFARRSPVASAGTDPIAHARLMIRRAREAPFDARSPGGWSATFGDWLRQAARDIEGVVPVRADFAWVQRMLYGLLAAAEALRDQAALTDVVELSERAILVEMAIARRTGARLLEHQEHFDGRRPLHVQGIR